jgi:cholestenol delta-isomerase
MNPSHSYYPVGVEIPNYVPNEWSTLALVSTFAVTCVIVLGTAKHLATKANPGIAISELSKALWSTLCKPPPLFFRIPYSISNNKTPKAVPSTSS